MTNNAETHASTAIPENPDRAVTESPTLATTWRKVVAEAAADLEAEHAPFDGDDRLCQVCSGGYPCTSRLVADDLRALLTPVASDLDVPASWEKIDTLLASDSGRSTDV